MARAVLLDRAAESDLIEIWVYTFENWSAEQADRYLDTLNEAIGALALHPERGRSRHGLREGYFSRRAFRHVIFYTFSETEVRIRRVLHEVMDIDRHL